MTLTIRQARKIGQDKLNWSQKISLATKYARARLLKPAKFCSTKKSKPGGIQNLDRIVQDILK